MSDKLTIPPTEHGLVRVFDVDLPLDEAEPLIEDDAVRLARMTGATTLDPDHIDLFDLNDLGGMPLADYLAEGHGIPEDEIAPLRSQLDRVKGSVMVMRSAAFDGIGQSLRIARPLRWIATFGEERDQVPLEKLRAESATGSGGEAPAPSDPKRTRGAAAVLAILVLGAILAVVFGLFGVRL